MHMVIEFDGGTSCNIPSRGYGIGYGSFRIDGGAVQKRTFGNMSANAAEIRTLVEGAIFAKSLGATSLHIKGDSQIALKWADVAAGNRKGTKLSKGVSPEFRDAIRMLSVLHDIPVTTEWHPRIKSVEAFGH